MAPGSGALRLTRVALFALAAVGLASAAHLAGGESVSPVLAMISVPAVMMVVNLLAAAKRSYASLFLAMALTQVALHLGFMAGSISRSCQFVGGRAMAGMPDPASSPHAVLHCSSSMTHDGAAGGRWPSTPMLLAHVLAAAVLVALLAHGEAAVWALAALLGFRMLRAGEDLRLPVVSRLAVANQGAFRPRSSVRRRGVRRRGPPGSVFAVC